VAERYAPILSALADSERGSILVVEPGIPRSGEFISLLRTQLLMLGRRPLAPCTHAQACPVPGGRRGAKWCHFAFETDEAPEALHRLSQAAGLPKERATVSFLWAGTGGNIPEASGQSLRVLSDPFPVGIAQKAGPGRSSGRPLSRDQRGSPERELGRYACSEKGLILIKGPSPKVQGLAAGSFLELKETTLDREVDPKSGAPVINLK